MEENYMKKLNQLELIIWTLRESNNEISLEQIKEIGEILELDLGE